MMFGFDGCCCCTMKDYDFSGATEIDSTITIVSGDWSLVDGALQTTSDNARLAFPLTFSPALFPGGGMSPIPVTRLPVVIDIANLSSGAEFVVSTVASGETSDTELTVFTGGTPGKIARTNWYETFVPGGLIFTADDPPEIPATLPTSFRLYNQYQRFLFDSTAPSEWALQLPSDDEHDWRSVIGNSQSVLSWGSLGSGSLNGSALRVNRIRFLRIAGFSVPASLQTCLDNPPYVSCPNASLNIGPLNDGFYVTLSGFSGGFASFNGTYHLNAENRYKYTWEGSFSDPTFVYGLPLENPWLKFWQAGNPEYNGYVGVPPWYGILSIETGTDTGHSSWIFWGTAGTTQYAYASGTRLPYVPGSGGTIQRAAMAWNDTPLYVNCYINPSPHDAYPALFGQATITSDPVWPS